jgi:hypothetical protein
MGSIALETISGQHGTKKNPWAADRRDRRTTRGASQGGRLGQETGGRVFGDVARRGAFKGGRRAPHGAAGSVGERLPQPR